MARRNETNVNLKTALLAVGLITIVVATMVIPVSDKNDIYVDFTVTQPVLGAPEFTDVNVYAHPSTLLPAPALGNILTSGTVVVLAKTTTKQARATVGAVYRTTDSTGTVVIRNVPTAERDVTVELYEDSKLVTSKVVILR